MSLMHQRQNQKDDEEQVANTFSAQYMMLSMTRHIH